MIYVVIFLFLLMALGAIVHVTGGIASSCEVETNKSSANITCKFQIDLSHLENEFLIDHIWQNGSGYKQETILQCQKLGGDISYHVRNGYKLLKSSANNTIIVQIPKVSQEHEGKYLCAAIPSDASEIQTCDLSAEAIASSTSPETDPHNEALNDNSIIEEDKLTTDSSNLLGVVLGLCIALALFLVLLIVVIVVIIVCKRRMKNKVQTDVSEALVAKKSDTRKRNLLKQFLFKIIYLPFNLNSIVFC